MRIAFVETLVELAQKDSRIVLLTADLGYLIVERFASKFPDRFFNVGVSEENMIGLATGLAEAGYIPFVYSVVTFAVLRPYEFIRNGPILHQLPVRIIGIGGGLEYSHDGLSHYGLEDVGVLRVQPGITIIAPADYEQAKSALLATWSLSGPVYYRLSKDDKTVIPGLDGLFELGSAQVIREGDDALIVTMGSIANQAVTAAEKLADEGVSVTVMVVASIRPEPPKQLVIALSRFKLVITVEAHYLVGGIGSFVAELIAEHGLECKLVRCGIKDTLDCLSGNMNYLYSKYGISGDCIAVTVLKELGR